MFSLFNPKLFATTKVEFDTLEDALKSFSELTLEIDALLHEDSLLNHAVELLDHQKERMQSPETVFETMGRFMVRKSQIILVELPPLRSKMKATREAIVKLTKKVILLGDQDLIKSKLKECEKAGCFFSPEELNSISMPEFNRPMRESKREDLDDLDEKHAGKMPIVTSELPQLESDESPEEKIKCLYRHFEKQYSNYTKHAMIHEMAVMTPNILFLLRLRKLALDIKLAVQSIIDDPQQAADREKLSAFSDKLKEASCLEQAAVRLDNFAEFIYRRLEALESSKDGKDDHEKEFLAHSEIITEFKKRLSETLNGSDSEKALYVCMHRLGFNEKFLYSTEVYILNKAGSREGSEIKALCEKYETMIHVFPNVSGFRFLMKHKPETMLSLCKVLPNDTFQALLKPTQAEAALFSKNNPLLVEQLSDEKREMLNATFDAAPVERSALGMSYC